MIITKADLLNWGKEIGPIGFLDIAIMSVLIYIVIVGFKRTRAAFVLTGIFILAGIYLITRQFNLIMTASVFEKFFAVILVILVVIFQEELKHFFEEVAVWSLNRHLIHKKTTNLSRAEVETLIRTLMDLARERIGALIVIRGKNFLNRHLDGEVNLNGELSEPLLKSIFDPHSIGHDGATVIEGNRIAYFSGHLPLSKNLTKIKDRGTRHAAALGLSEVSDAICLVVSEEKGTISVAQGGDIKEINDPEQLTLRLEKFYDEVSPRQRLKPWEEFFRKNTKEKIYAFILALGLWLVLVYGSKMTYKSFIVPVSYTELPEKWIVEEMDPKEVEVTFRGPRTAFYFSVKEKIKLYPDLKKTKGHQRIRIYTEDFVFPKGLILEEYDPHTIRVTLKQKAEETTTADKPEDTTLETK